MSIAGLMRQYRKKTGATVSQLCAGICDDTMMRRIESGQRKPSVFVLRALLSRLGLDAEKYYLNVSNESEANFFNLHHEIEALIMCYDYDAAQAKQQELQVVAATLKKNEGSHVRKQMILANACAISVGRDEYANLLKLLDVAIKLTLADYTHTAIAVQILSYQEVELLNMLATTLRRCERLDEGIKVLQAVQASIDKYHTDEYEKSRGYIVTMCNLSTFLGFAARHQEALIASESGIRCSVKHKRLYLLPHLKFNKACALHMLGGQQEKVRTLVVDAIYALRNNEDYADANRRIKYAKDVMGLDIAIEATSF
jgi:transcriptional regulator with XRE-family HTH domain